MNKFFKNRILQVFFKNNWLIQEFFNCKKNMVLHTCKSIVYINETFDVTIIFEEIYVYMIQIKILKWDILIYLLFLKNMNISNQ